MERLSTRGRLLLVAAAMLAPALADAALLKNGTLLDGAGTKPSAWRSEAWNADASRFGWSTDDERGTLAITNLLDNDARWCQTVAVAPGATYRVSAEVRTAKIPQGAAGAFISIEPRIGHSRLIDGTNAWQRMVVTLKADGPRREWDVCLRLGSNGSLNTGTAYFRNVAMTLVRPGSDAGGPSVLAMLTAWTRRASWTSMLLPIGAGVLLAFGLGVFDRRR